LRDVKSRTAFMGVLAFAGGIGLIGQLAMMAGAYAYSREHETEADRIGVQLMRSAGYDPRESARVWTHLREELTAGAGGDPAKRSVMFATHPPTDERQRALQELAGSDGGFLGDDTFAEHIDPFMADLLDDELRRAQYDESVVLLTRLAARRPQRGDLRFARGEALRLRAKPGDADEAMSDYRSALGLERPPAQAHRAIGLLHRQQGQKAEAAKAFNQYLLQAPTAPDTELILSYLNELKT
jgi:predicted Zn-dependent protease